MNADQAIAFVREHGVVLASAKGPAPRLTEAIAGEAIKGSWWAHRMSHRIFAILQAVAGSDDVLVCRLVDGKVTFIHRRLWPALVRAAKQFPPERLAQVFDEHTSAGHHVSREVLFPQWVPGEVKALAEHIDEAEALAALGPWVADVQARVSAARAARTRKRP